MHCWKISYTFMVYTGLCVPSLLYSLYRPAQNPSTAELGQFAKADFDKRHWMQLPTLDRLAEPQVTAMAPALQGPESCESPQQLPQSPQSVPSSHKA